VTTRKARKKGAVESVELAPAGLSIGEGMLAYIEPGSGTLRIRIPHHQTSTVREAGWRYDRDDAIKFVLDMVALLETQRELYPEAG
jgi:hypothetical protein